MAAGLEPSESALEAGRRLLGDVYPTDEAVRSDPDAFLRDLYAAMTSQEVAADE